jgi:phosphopantetheine binding protein
MDQALAAVVGAALGSLGTAGAASLAAWSTRRQARAQDTRQTEQWRRESRREAYGALLDTGARARDDLASLWRFMSEPSANATETERRLIDARALVHAVQKASNTVSVEGPVEILEPARTLETGIALFYTLLQAASRGQGDLKEGARYRILVRDALASFVTTAREVLEPPDRLPEADPLPAVGETKDLGWLVDHLTAALGAPVADLDLKLSPMALGLDSISALLLCRALEQEYGLSHEDSWRLTVETSVIEFSARLSAIRADEPYT